MSSYLWKYYFEDDVERFSHVLANATYSASAAGSKTGRGGNTGQIESTGTSLSTSPALTAKGKRTQRGPASSTNLSRADLNWKDGSGNTLLHYVVSSTKPTAHRFALALCQVPLVDLYVQDEESGWTALHRALYFGNVTIARILMDRDLRDAAGHGHVGGLIKIKDHEGNSPFDVYGASIASRSIRRASTMPLLSGSSDDDENENAQGTSGDHEDENHGARVVVPRIKVDGDELYAFGSNKNFTLGFGDEDDRQFPERIILKRPEHLLRRLNVEHQLTANGDGSMSALPAVVQYRPIIIQDAHLSKLHSAILTTDPEANLYMCGFGKGGRLGTGDEATRFHYVPIYKGGLMGKKVIHVALGQDHSIAISSEGEVYAWGNNVSGQLGFATQRLPDCGKVGAGNHDEEPTQLLPRQIFGQLKREIIVGAAASRIHTVVHTSTSLYTFGKNAGQLGLVDSDARSLVVQTTPRKVAASLFKSAIHAVSAIDKATICLLETHEVWVLANYGYTKVVFPAEGFTNYFLKAATFSTRYGRRHDEICKITSGGDTICAMSSSGDVFTVHVSQNNESPTPGAIGAIGATGTRSGVLAVTSTTNPGKIPRALSPPQRIWSMEKGNMAVVDVDVGQDGSIIICTDSGSVWRRVKRAKIKDANASSSTGYKFRDYKFSRVPGLTRIVAVRSNAFGAYAAVRKDCDVLQTQVGVDNMSLWADLHPLLPVYGLSAKENAETEDPAPRFWVPAPAAHDTATIRRAILQNPDIEDKLSLLLPDVESSATYDLRIGTSLSQVLLPVHEFIVAGRSELLRRALTEFRQTYFFTIPEVMTIEYDSDGKTLIQFQGVDFLTVLNLVLYVYTDTVVDVWHHTRHAPSLAYRYRQVRSELMKVASILELSKLEHAVRLMVEPPKSLHIDFGLAIKRSDYFGSGEIEVALDGQTLKLHQALICQRCPFFEGLFNGRAAGAWLHSRREDPQEPIKVDLKHVDPSIFQIILQHIYADTDEAVFDNVNTDNFDSFIDIIMEVMSVANELMLDRLAQCCQKLLGRFVNTRNICQFLNAIAPCSVTEFKNAALEYICLNLEGMLENHLLAELEEDLLLALDEVVRQNQVACMPFSKSGRAEAELFDRYPGLINIVERGRRAKVDSFRLQSRLRDEESYYASAAKARPVTRDGNDDTKGLRSSNSGTSDYDMGARGALKSQNSIGDLMFEMEEESDETSAAVPKAATRSRVASQLRPFDKSQAASPTLAFARTGQSPDLASSFDTSVHPPQNSSWISHELPEKSPRKSSGGAKFWGSSVLESSKLDMKEIIAQASSQKVSALSSGLTNKAQASGGGTNIHPAKLSQRERKRQQQQQQLQQDVNPPVIASHEPSEQSPVSKASPWRQTSTGQKVSLHDVLSAESSASAITPSEQLYRKASNPPLTMRQTVPGNAAALRRSASGDPAQNTTPLPTRSTSTPNVGSSPTIRSIRHTPLPVEPSLQLSMSDILVQQQTEKDVIKDAVSKRSLQEIQEEQAFQEWWDQESKKVREREEENAHDNNKSRRSSRGRSRGRGRGNNVRGKGRGSGSASG